jgi:hypothetical protein
MIATRLPIDYKERVYIQLPHGSSQPSSPMDDKSLEENALAALLKDPEITSSSRGGGGQMNKRRLEPILEDSDETNVQAVNKKISSLEMELARLRSQIAICAIMEQQEQCQEAPPPPPPPPLPSIAEMEAPPIDPPTDTPTSSTPMTSQHYSSLAQNIENVKLKKLDIQKSPGGTPMRPKAGYGSSSSTDDPAAIIANALRLKFSHRIFQDSPGKENTSDNSFNEFNDSTGPSIKLVR